MDIDRMVYMVQDSTMWCHCGIETAHTGGKADHTFPGPHFTTHSPRTQGRLTSFGLTSASNKFVANCPAEPVYDDFAQCQLSLECTDWAALCGGMSPTSFPPADQSAAQRAELQQFAPSELVCSAQCANAVHKWEQGCRDMPTSELTELTQERIARIHASPAYELTSLRLPAAVAQYNWNGKDAFGLASACAAMVIAV